MFVDDTLVSSTYGPFGPVNVSTFDWAGVFGPLSAGTHKYMIEASDSNGNLVQTMGSFDMLATAALIADASAPPLGSSPVLTDCQLQPIIIEAEQRLTAATGIDVAAFMTGASVRIADLPANVLAEAVDHTIYLSRNAAGYGWFVDPTPALDEEIASLGGNQQLKAVDQQAVDRIDLLTFVEHELGRIMGLSDFDLLADHLMTVY